MPVNSQKTADKWRFARLGGFDQVELNRSADLLALPSLDQKLWATLSCPTQGLYFDQETLAFLDSDHDGRIRANEVIAAVSWAGKVLKNPADLLQKKPLLPLAAINDADPEGKQLLSSSREILKNLGKQEAVEISFEDLADISRIFADTRFNGDGIIPEKAGLDDDFARQAIADIMLYYGSESDRCGDPGVNQEKIRQFFCEAQTYNDWRQRKPVLQIKSSALENISEESAALLTELKTKIDDYFTRCQLAEFDKNSAVLLNPTQIHYEQLAGKNLSAHDEELAALPLAAIQAGKDLPLNKGLNPAWSEQISRLKTDILIPLFGDMDSLSYPQWQTLLEKFADFRAWQLEKPETVIEELGAERIKQLLESGVEKRLTSLLEQDLALAGEAEAIDSVNRLLHYYRDLYTLLNNFVSFRDFYTAEPHAIFQAGVLYLDGRSCQLCVMVDDIDKHSRLADLSKIFLAYCLCRRPGGNETISIAAAFTGGDSDNLMVGRNGVFYDRNGLDWDATIVKIINHPISIAQAFWSPYKSVARMLNTQIEKSASVRDKAAHENAFKGVTSAGEHIEQGKAAPTAFDVGKFAGIFAAIGLAIGAIGTALASVIGSFMTLHWWQMPLAIAGMILLISGPSMLIAYLKLRQRNLAPVLDACGWAVNAKAYINLPFGRQLTGVAKLPKDAERQLLDPFGEKKKPWASYLLLALILIAGIVLWEKGYLAFSKESTEAVKPEQAAETPPQIQPEAAQPQLQTQPQAKPPAPVVKK